MGLKQKVGEDLGFCVQKLLPKVSTTANFNCHKSCESWGIIFPISRVTSHCSYDKRVIALWYHPENICYQKYRDSGDLLLLIFHVTARNHLLNSYFTFLLAALYTMLPEC